LSPLFLSAVLVKKPDNTKNLDRFRTRIMKNYISFSLALLCLIFIALGCGSTNTNSTTSSSTPASTTNAANGAKPVAAASPTGPTISDVKWADYDKIYNVKSTSTDMQKEAQWKNFEGKYVSWQGTVNEVSEGTLTGLTVTIKMNPGTITSDIVLTPKDSQKEKMMSLTKGQKISFTGRLNRAGGAVLPLSMDDGEIK
jgi:hypothetical protein